eukprot:1161967-Pelagomonas_calceolata.AAC.7
MKVRWVPLGRGLWSNATHRKYEGARLGCEYLQRERTCLAILLQQWKAGTHSVWPQPEKEGQKIPQGCPVKLSVSNARLIVDVNGTHCQSVCRKAFHSFSSLLFTSLGLSLSPKASRLDFKNCCNSPPHRGTLSPRHLALPPTLLHASAEASLLVSKAGGQLSEDPFLTEFCLTSGHTLCASLGTSSDGHRSKPHISKSGVVGNGCKDS